VAAYTCVVLSASNPVRHPVRRVLVAGVTGVGKSTLAQRIGELSGIPYIEIDALYHGPDWTALPTFSTDIDALVATETWVTEWQYRSARDRLAAAADTLVWLDYPVRVSLTRLIRRTVVRRLGKQKLWAGNVEAPLWHFFLGRDHILAWALKTRHTYARLVPQLEADAPNLQVVRLRNQSQTDAWVIREFGGGGDR